MTETREMKLGDLRMVASTQMRARLESVLNVDLEKRAYRLAWHARRKMKQDPNFNPFEWMRVQGQNEMDEAIRRRFGHSKI